MNAGYGTIFEWELNESSVFKWIVLHISNISMLYRERCQLVYRRECFPLVFARWFDRKQSDILHMFTLVIKLTCSSCWLWFVSSRRLFLFSVSILLRLKCFHWKIYWLFWWDVGEKSCNGEQNVQWRWTDTAAPPSLSRNQSLWPLSPLSTLHFPLSTLHSPQSYHPAAQDWLPTEAKQGWAWSVPGWETSWEN